MTPADGLGPGETHMLAWLAERSDALVRRAIDWSEIGSGSGNLEGLARMADVLEGELVQLPGLVERIALPPVESISSAGEARQMPQGECLRISVRQEASVHIALTGHYDTVFGLDSPFQAATLRTDGRLNGPGIADMKGGISVMLGALAAWETHPRHHEVGYTVLLSPDEETGSLASGPLLADLAARARVGLTYEPALADGALVSSRKGSGNFHVAFRGRAAHAGRDFDTGRNAVLGAARMAAALDQLNGRREGVTVNVARIDGGGPLNLVPDLAILRFNVRLPDEEASSWIEAGIREALDGAVTEGIRADLHGAINRPPKLFDARQQRLFEEVRRTGELIGQSLRWSPSGGVCEGNNLFAHGLPNVDTLGVRGGAIHSMDEFAIPESFVERAQLSALLLARLPHFIDCVDEQP